MRHRSVSVLLVVVAPFVATLPMQSTPACCPAPKSGQRVVNADQTVILIWDPATQTEHFIRKASFRADGEDFGFLIPSPKQPELEESGNEAFPFLAKLTEPEVQKVPRPSGMQCGCSDGQTRKALATAAGRPAVEVRAEKEVAGFHAVVLEATSAKDLVHWLKEHDYAYSPAIEAWAKPYVDSGWMITALKVAAGKAGEAKTVDAGALRLSFKTDRPLFPYREPDSEKSAEALNSPRRLLRIYFVADARYKGELTKDVQWTGNAVWTNKLRAEDRDKTLAALKLPPSTGPAEWWLTEFEEYWPYRVAPADLYFARDADQSTLKRPPIIQYVAAPLPTDVTVYAIAGGVILPSLWRRLRGRRMSA
jgi:hypothetical protein